jgi:hypothetical protein
MTATKGVIATFNTAYPLTITKLGTGSGTVFSRPEGIICGDSCTFYYASTTSVTLTAAATTGSAFIGWSGGCTGNSDTCTVSVTALTSVIATFNTAAMTYPLIVNKSGTGKGTVASTTAGINCGDDCNENYAADTSVTLKATPSNGSIFTGWSGGCAGTKNTCTLSITEAKGVVATFTALVPDFVITGIKLIPATPTADIPFKVRVTVKNEGKLKAGKNVSMQIWLNQPNAQKCGSSGDMNIASIGNLAAGQSKPIDTLINGGVRPTSTSDKKTLRVFVDSECVVNESNENNNQGTKVYNVRR